MKVDVTVLRNNPKTAAAAGVVGLAALAAWLFRRKKGEPLAILPEEVREEIFALLKKVEKFDPEEGGKKAKGKILSDEEFRLVYSFLGEEFEEDSLAEELQGQVEELMVMAAAAKSGFAMDEKNLAEAKKIASEAKDILKKMAKKEDKEKGWIKAL